MSHYFFFRRISVCLALCLMTGLWFNHTAAQTQRKTPAKTKLAKPSPEPDYSNNAIRPIYVTTRIFQLTKPKGTQAEPTDQVFRMRTAALVDEEQWQKALQKTYPGFAPALLQTFQGRLFRTNRPLVITLGEQNQRLLQIQVYAAQSVGDGVTPGTTLAPELGLYFHNNTAKPLTLSLQPLEVESGRTYFYCATSFRPSEQEYVGFMRRGAPVAPSEQNDVLLALSFSVELDKQPVTTVRILNEQQSAALLSAAQKKVQPEMPAGLRQLGLSGKVQVRVEITPDGKVVKALTQNSTLPELNSAAVAAARQWEFSPTLFTDKKEPVSGLLTFEFPIA